MPRWALIAGSGLFSAIAVIGVVCIVTGHVAGDPPADAGGLPAWCIGVLALSAFHLGPTALELVLADDELLWQSPLLTGSIEVADLESVSPFGAFGVLAVLGTTTASAPASVDTTRPRPPLEGGRGLVARAAGVSGAGSRRR